MIDDNRYPGLYDFIEQVFHGVSQIAKGGYMPRRGEIVNVRVVWIYFS